MTRAALNPRRRTALAAALLACLAACAPLPAFAAGKNETATTGRFSGTVERVRDGDSLRLAGAARDLRLWGIDAPEKNRPGGAEAREALAGLVVGRRVDCRARHVDRYGRTVAQCWLDGEDVAAWLVEHGHARDWPKFSGGHYARQPVAR